MTSSRTTRVRAVTAVLTAASAGIAGLVAQPATAADGSESTYLVVAPRGQGSAKAVAALQRAGGDVVADYRQIGVVVARATAGEAAEVQRAGVGAVASTEGLGGLLDEGDADVDAAATPTDESLWSLQWDMRAINVAEAHQINAGDRDVVVGVLDSGIAANHPDLAGQVDPALSADCNSGAPDTSYTAWQPTTSDHGTHVAGTIAAADNGIGVIGVAPGVTLASVKVVNDSGFIYPQAALCGFMWAAEHGFELTNNSYYIDPWEFNCRNDERQRPVWQAIQRAIRYSSSQGVLNVASAGNSNVDLQHKFIDDGSPNDGSAPVEERLINGACVDLPAEAPGVVTVSATGYTNLKSYYSSYGLGVVEVAAPGGDTRVRNPNVSTVADAILSTTRNSRTGALGWGYKQGTSMASPHATGVAALALSAQGDMSPGQLASFVQRTAEPLPCPEGVYDPRPGLDQYRATCSGGQVNGFYGHGLVDALDAVQ